jgi:hypothetical protein
LVGADRENPVSTLVALTAAVPTIAPVWSFTVPTMEPVVCCASIDAKLANIRTANTHERRAEKNETILLKRFSDITWNLQKDFHKWFSFGPGTAIVWRANERYQGQFLIVNRF